MEIKIYHVDQEKNSMIHLDFCKRNECFVFLLTNFCYSLFQVIASIGDIAVHLGFENITRHDSCSALIKVKKILFYY